MAFQEPMQHTWHNTYQRWQRCSIICKAAAIRVIC